MHRPRWRALSTGAEECSRAAAGTLRAIAHARATDVVRHMLITRNEAESLQ